MATDWLDNILQTAGDTGAAVIDAWGRVQVASYDAQVQPPAPTPLAGIPSTATGGNMTMLIVAGIALVGVFLVLKK